MFDQLPKLPKSSKRIILLLAEEGTLTQKEIITLSGIPAKTVRYALKKLGSSDLLVTKPSLMDMRSSFYSLNPDYSPLIHQHVEEAKIAIES